MYSFGLGEDISFDEAIIGEYGLHVWGFDMTPKALAYTKTRLKSIEPRHHFHLTGEGLSTEPGNVTFTLPKNKAFVSVRMGKGDPRARPARAAPPANPRPSPSPPGERPGQGGTITAPVNTLKNFMSRFGHKHVDILKLDIEGEEFPVIADMAERSDFPFTQLLVETHLVAG